MSHTYTATIHSSKLPQLKQPRHIQQVRAGPQHLEAGQEGELEEHLGRLGMERRTQGLLAHA